MAFSPDASKVASGSLDETVHVRGVGAGKCVRTLEVHCSRMLPVTWSPDGSEVAPGTVDRTVRVWDAGTGECVEVHGGSSTLPWACSSQPQSIVAMRDVAGFEHGGVAYIGGSAAACVDQLDRTTLHILRLRGRTPIGESDDD